MKNSIQSEGYKKHCNESEYKCCKTQTNQIIKCVGNQNRSYSIYSELILPYKQHKMIMSKTLNHDKSTEANRIQSLNLLIKKHGNTKCYKIFQRWKIHKLTSNLGYKYTQAFLRLYNTIKCVIYGYKRHILYRLYVYAHIIFNSLNPHAKSRQECEHSEYASECDNSRRAYAKSILDEYGDYEHTSHTLSRNSYRLTKLKWLFDKLSLYDNKVFEYFMKWKLHAINQNHHEVIINNHQQGRPEFLNGDNALKILQITNYYDKYQPTMYYFNKWLNATNIRKIKSLQTLQNQFKEFEYKNHHENHLFNDMVIPYCVNSSNSLMKGKYNTYDKLIRKQESFSKKLDSVSSKVVFIPFLEFNPISSVGELREVRSVLNKIIQSKIYRQSQQILDFGLNTIVLDKLKLSFFKLKLHANISLRRNACTIRINMCRIYLIIATMMKRVMEFGFTRLLNATQKSKFCMKDSSIEKNALLTKNILTNQAIIGGILAKKIRKLDVEIEVRSKTISLRRILLNWSSRKNRLLSRYFFKWGNILDNWSLKKRLGLIKRKSELEKQKRELIKILEGFNTQPSTPSSLGFTHCSLKNRNLFLEGNYITPSTASQSNQEEASIILKSLSDHGNALANQYVEYIRVKNQELQRRLEEQKKEMAERRKFMRMKLNVKMIFLLLDKLLVLEFSYGLVFGSVLVSEYLSYNSYS